MSRARHCATGRLKGGEESQAGAHTVSDQLQSCALGATSHPPARVLNPLAIRGNRGSGRESRDGAAAVELIIIKRNGGKSQTVSKTKEETIWRSRRSLGSKTPEARKLAVGFAAGILCEQPGRNWQYVKVGRGRECGRKGKSVPRRLRAAGKCHQGERGGTE